VSGGVGQQPGPPGGLRLLP